MKHKGHLQTYNHFSLVVRDAAACHKAWEKAFGVEIPAMMAPAEEMPEDLLSIFDNAPTFRGGPWPAPKYYGAEQPLLAPFYQPGLRMIEVKAAGTMPSLTEFYDRFGAGIQYFGIVEGDNRDPFLDELKDAYGVEKLEEMYYDPLPGDFCVAETEQLLGFNLCVKEDGAINGQIVESIPETAEAAVVVPSLEGAVKNWTDIFDIKTPEIHSVSEKGILHGEETVFTFRYARIDEMPFPLYLVESGAVSPFSEFAAKNGFGIHHITFRTEEENASFATRMKQGNGIDILTEYDLEGTHYTVFDSAEIMGARIAVAEN